ncbi:MAG: hypothetical protein JW863_14605 [Chitinispirillaceae bacterium]|nr:hypothetical protein [Chitinispirillaceae bacterium]
MKSLFFTGTIALLLTAPVSAFDCKVFIPTQEGAEYVTTSYNKRDKPETIVHRKLTKVETVGDKTVFYMHQLITDKKGKKPLENTYRFNCRGGIFYVDMKLFLNQPQMKAYQDMEMTVDADGLEMPKEGTAGQKLNDGKITATVNMGMPLKINVTVSNRTVNGTESITTSAGTFECIKLTEDVDLQIAFVKTAYRTVTWYAENHGVIRQETYNPDKPEKPTGYSVLTEIRK